tara:strand:- start:192 stop:881 length:690 start_codon:yes stop_codon:yes gene_type:complete
MKTLGVIGGMGPQASIRFLELVIRSCTDDFGIRENEEFPRIVLSSLPAPDIIENRDREEQAGDMLAREAKTLEQAGADFLVMTCNTMHILSDRFTSATSIPFLSIIETVTQQAQCDGRACVGLLGSETTMSSDLYKEPLREAGIDVLVPFSPERKTVVDCILSVIAGSASTEEVQVLQRMINTLKARGAEAVILGCTELPLLINQAITDVPVLDSLQILATASCKEIFT